MYQDVSGGAALTVDNNSTTTVVSYNYYYFQISHSQSVLGWYIPGLSELPLRQRVLSPAPSWVSAGGGG